MFSSSFLDCGSILDSVCAIQDSKSIYFVSIYFFEMLFILKKKESFRVYNEK